ncbi:protocadherin Fat 4-like [Aulostomus maculatus]
MGAGGQRPRTRSWWVALRLSIMLGCMERVSAQVKYSIAEEVKVGSVVGNVAKDLGLDVGSLEERRFRIVSGAEGAQFEVNQNNGVLYVHRKIDREQLCERVAPCVVNLKLVAENPMEIHHVAVEILDVNDNSPSFQEEEKVIEISESTPPGKRFQLPTARDPDVVINTVRLYKLNQNEHFSIQIRDRGEDKVPFLILQKALDREKHQEHRLILTAVDGGNPPRSGTLNVTVIVLDSNDNHPIFGQEVYSVTISENIKRETSVTQVQASDPDEGSNGEIEYYFGGELDPNIYDTFSLDRDTGEIRVKAEIDFEKADVYKLDVHATDKGQPPMSTDCRVIIKVLDENDNEPEIDVTSLSKTISEDSKPGTVISLISITDKDVGLNGKVICGLSDNVPFELKPSFQDNMYSLVLKHRLDRETVSEYDVTITATDCGQPPLSSSKTLAIEVADVNDNVPQFPHNPIEIYIRENNVPGDPIFSVTASDQDLNENAALTYHIAREEGSGVRMSAFLNVNPENGQISALKSFDFETLKTFQFQVVASDSGSPSLSSNVTVKVFILDQNDNAPVILYPVSSNGSAEGVEEIPRNVNAGHLVTKVRAYDADIGYNGWLLFSLQEVSEHSLFALDRYTGQIRTLRSFTETDEAEQKLIILVKDNGNVSLSATATVLLKVVEPKEAFAASDLQSSAKVEEDSHVTFYLIITLGSVSLLFLISMVVLIAMQCSKSTDYTSKYLQDANYDGTLCHSIQYRSGDKRYMLVGPRMSIGSTIVPGSHANTLVLPDRRRTSEEDANYDGTLCHSIQYRSGDKRYMLVGPRMSIGSTVVPGSHANTLVLPDRRRTSEEAFALIKYSIPEEVKDGTVVGNVAKDLGIDITSLVDRRFRVVSGTKQALFEVNQGDGALYVHKTVDREDLCQGSGACLVELKIIVENPLEVHYVVVEITDVNDHSPSFPEKQQNFEIGEQTLPGKRFQLHAANDPDAGINSIRTYTLTANEHFEVDIRQSDEDKIPFLVLKKSLDREQKAKHSLLVTAVDGGKPQRSATLNVTIVVFDINDNRPTFSQDVYQITIQENIPIGTSVFRINATDPDEGVNGEIEYGLSKTLKKTVYDIFELDKITGEVRVKGAVDYEDNDVYKLDVEASDNGTPPLTGECRVVIKIKDVNDNPPEIEVTSLSNSVSEDSKPGTVVALISTTDHDSGGNGKIISSITNDVPFELKPSYKENTYSVVTKEFLDREQVSNYEIIIKATDCGEPPLSAIKTLNIQVSDVNDNKPKFSENPLWFYLTENNVAGASIFSVSATDSDENENAALTYNIVREGSQKEILSFLNINPETGDISALKSFDFETLKTFQFQVVASDSGSPSLSSNVTVKVFILDQNDNAPVILYPVSSNGSAEGVEEIPRNVNAGHLVTKVRAYDADIGYNGWLLFSLQEVSEHSLFALDRYTGQIRTLRSFTETDEAEQKLIILVKDNGNVSLSATATVLLKVVEPKEAFAASDLQSSAKVEEDSHVTFYLIITLGSVSLLFLISMVVLIAMQCSKSTDYTSKYLQDANYDGTLCHSIQYRSGDKRYMLVGPRMSIGSTIVPGSHANTLVLPDRRRTSEEAQAQIRYSVPEEVKEGTVVGNVAKDLGLDISSLADRRFRVVSGTKDAIFEVNQNNGALYVQDHIDREDLCAGSGACLIELKILVENPLEIHYVVVEITDVNDHSPSFPEKQQTFEIAEHTSPGKRFQLHTALDPDAGINSIRTYTLTSSEHFEINIRQSDAGKIPFLVLKKSLDREQKDKHSLLVTAVDGGKPQRSATLNVTIVVLDSNDNHPMFSQDIYQVTIQENIPVGTSVFKLNATDPDEGVNGEIEYGLGKTLRQKVYDFFELDKRTGEVRVKGRVDYEETDMYELDVEASDKGTPPMTGECRVIIKVKDVNDNPPEIEVTSLSNSVPEDSKPGTVVSLLSLIDKDSGVNGKIISHITSDVPFELKPSYKENIYSVVTKGLLDREQESNYEIKIEATDCGEPPLSAIKTLNIQVSDVNDNSPHFEQNPLDFYLTENNVAGASIFSVSATDKDVNENAAITYNIVRTGKESDATSFLNINPETGDISALKSFDFETLKTFQFQVVASDSGSPSLSSNVTVKVFILDQNDNAPVILYPVSSNGSAEGVEEIPRNVNVGHLVTKVRAYDADIGYNGWLLFSLQEVSEHSLFALDRYTGQIRTLRSFTETDEAEQKLIILVKDNGNVSLSATATVLLKVVEPKEAFAASDLQSSAKVEEDSHVTFYLIITLGSVSLLFLISMVVLIAMQCSKSTDYTSKYLQDANYDGTLCHSIQYRSGDKRYMLVGPRMSIGSTIVPGSHANTLVLPDRRGASGELRDMLVWLGIKFSSELIRTSGQITYSISEEIKEGSTVGNLAKDLGIDPSILKARGFRIVSGSAEPPFQVNQDNGVLFVSRHIDREEMCQRTSVCLINLKSVLDNPLEIHYIAVEVLDINDHSPSFPEKNKRLEIFESTVPGTRFQLHAALDPDGGVNSIQQYKLSQNNNFRIEVKDRGKDGKVPILLLQSPLDREVTSSHKLLLTALDGGKPPKSGSMEILIDVLDVNDNAPLFTREAFTADVRENSPAGTTVIRVNATDLDEGLNGEVSYSFGNVHSKVRELFHVDPSTGEITVKGQLDYEVDESYEIDIQASDSGVVPLRTDKSVTVNIKDINDNAPVIEVTSQSERIPEDSRPGTTVALISITDLDSGVNGKVISFVKGDVPFTLTPSIQDNMFAVVTKSQLDRENESSYDVTIIAKDAGEPALTSEKTLRVVLADINDNYPKFSLARYDFYVTENNSPGVSIFSVKASDCDEGENGVVIYHIHRDASYESKVTSFLNINPETGDISALRSFDFETLKTFQFQVVASDSGSPSLSSNVTVKVFILDQNDNAPVILYPVSSNGSAEGVEEIPRNVNVGHLVTKVRAYDADIGYNGWLLFSLQEVSEHSLFALDRYTGQIRTLRSFTETDEAEQKLIILVKDNGNVSLSATATVLLKVVEPKEAFAASDLQSSAKVEEDSHVTFYLIITLGSVSLLFLISMVVLIAMQCSKSTDYTSKYLQDANYDGTLCHSIQYRSGDKRYMLVGPRMSIGSTIVPGSHANTLVLPDRRRTSEEDANYDGTLCHSIQYRSGDKRYMLVGPRMSIGSTIVPGSHANTLVLPDRRRTSEEVGSIL